MLTTIYKSHDGVNFQVEKRADLITDNYFITPKLGTMPTYKVVVTKDGESSYSNTVSKSLLKIFFSSADGIVSAEIIDTDKENSKITFTEEVEASGINKADFQVEMDGSSKNLSSVAINNSNKKRTYNNVK